MKKYIFISFVSFLFFIENDYAAQDSVKAVRDTLQFNGQISVWGHYNTENRLPALLGSRYLPLLHYSAKFPHEKILDFEASANLFGFFASHPFDTSSVDGSISPYRAWARFSTSQLEIRLGLQKINFGSASMLRPLMWFDQVDPRDPLKLTNGAWGLLSRYYFLNNANLWFWCLYGNNKPRVWDIGKTNKNIPEMGTRFQSPVPKGEIALSYHYRMVDTRDMGFNVPTFADINENRIGLDGKWDLGVGIWFESAWINKSKNIGVLSNQEILNIGADYTFNIGNGLNAVCEQLAVASDDHAFAFKNNIFFSGLSLSYPLGIVDNLNSIVYFDWENNAAYYFINWNHKFKKISLFLMAYWNPENYKLPQQGNSSNTYSGQGFQIMLVYNH